MCCKDVLQRRVVKTCCKEDWYKAIVLQSYKDLVAFGFVGSIRFFCGENENGEGGRRGWGGLG